MPLRILFPVAILRKRIFNAYICSCQKFIESAIIMHYSKPYDFLTHQQAGREVQAALTLRLLIAGKFEIHCMSRRK